MNLHHRPLQLSDWSSILHAVHRRVHRNREKAGDPGANADVEENAPLEGGKALPRTPAEQKEVVDRMEELERQLAHKQEELSRTKTEYEAMMAANDQLKARLTQLDCLPQQVKELQKKLEQEKQSAHKGWELYEGAVAATQQVKERLAQLEEDARRSGVRVSELERAHAVSEKERRSSVELLETRTTELREAQVFSTGTDDITDNEVLHLVETLNEVVAKTAAAIARASQFHYESVKEVAATEKAVRRIEHYGWIPPSLLSTLRAADHTRTITLVQTALQAGLIMYARWLATTWELGVVDPRGLLEGVYLQMREREPQSVAGRWRVLCRTHVKGLLDTGEIQTQRLFKSISGIVADVLVICGAAGSWESISDALAQGFETDLHEVVNRALQFQWTVGERIVSRDFALFTEQPDVGFDPTRMEDERTDGKKAPLMSVRKGRVLCTTHLGLMVEKKVRGGREDPEHIVSTMLLKPKVVTCPIERCGR